MEFHYRPSKIDPEGNVAKMLTEICRGLDATGKARFVATLDLQEPVVILRRYANSAQLDTVPLLTVLLRLRDPELTAAALASPRLNERRTYYSSSGTAGIDSVGKVLVREAMLQADPDLLQAIADSMRGADVDVGREFVYGGGSVEFGDALYALAEQADAADPMRVEACARWAHKVSEAFISKNYEDKSLKSERVRCAAELPKRNMEFSNMLLTLAAKRASCNLARAALAMGAKANETAAGEAFKSGAPALTLELLKRMPEELGGNQRLALCQSMVNAIGSLPENIQRERADRASDNSRILYCEPAFKKIAGDAGRAIELALDKPAGGDSVLGVAQRQLLAVTLPLLEYFDEPEKWMARQIEKYPEPTPAEVIVLARARKWRRLDTRLDDAERAGVASLWRQSIESAIASAALDAVRIQRVTGHKARVKTAGAGQKDIEDELDKKWFFKLAQKLSDHSLFKKSRRAPMKKLSDSGAYTLDEVLQAEARSEAGALMKATPQASSAQRAGSLRM